MIDGKMHDEIIYLGKLLIIDTADLGESYSKYFGSGRYETMVMRENGSDLECIRSETLEDAERIHNVMLNKYKACPAPLDGKYAKLRDDLIAAYAETEYLEQTEDGGTCNFDAPVIQLERWSADKIKQAAKEAGGSAYKWTRGKTVMGWVFSTRSSGQANRRSRRAEAISKAMKAKGYEAGMYYAMD